MRTFLALPAMYDGAKARRIAKVGRVELLRVIEEPPYWFVRIAGFSETRDRPRFKAVGSNFGNGYWRFAHYELAQAKFKQLSEQPETVREAKEQAILRCKNLERVQTLIRAGKWGLKKFLPQKDRAAIEKGHP